MSSACRVLLLVCLLAASMSAMTTEFTYQGFVRDGATPVNGAVDLRVSCFDAASAGTQIGATAERLAVTAEAGAFTILLDFGSAAFSGADRWLEIQVRLAGGAWTTLSPRQRVTPVPYAQRAAIADSLAVRCAFRVSQNDAVTMNESVNYVVPFIGETYDLNNDYDATTRTFTAPVRGIYHFDLRLQTQFGAAGGNVAVKLMHVVAGDTLVDFVAASGFGSFATALVSTDLLMAAGERIRPVVATAYATAGYEFQDGAQTNWFDGHLVMVVP